MGAMLLVVGWSSVVFWLNVTPRVRYWYVPEEEEPVYGVVRYGSPLTHANFLVFRTQTAQGHRILLPSLQPSQITSYRHLAANIAIGLIAVAVLTFASKYLVRAIVSGLRGFMSKPPPDKGEGPERAG